eukprot:1151434-Pelagomonas_calceolata.AAC.4
MPPACVLAFPEHTKHGFMSHASSFAEELACGGVLCGSGAVLHHFGKKAGFYLNPILRGATGGACWWGDPLGQERKPMQEVTLLCSCCISWQFKHILRLGVS